MKAIMQVTHCIHCKTDDHGADHQYRYDNAAVQLSGSYSWSLESEIFENEKSSEQSWLGSSAVCYQDKS